MWEEVKMSFFIGNVFGPNGCSLVGLKRRYRNSLMNEGLNGRNRYRLK